MNRGTQTTEDEEEMPPLQFQLAPAIADMNFSRFQDVLKTYKKMKYILDKADITRKDLENYKIKLAKVNQNLEIAERIEQIDREAQLQVLVSFDKERLQMLNEARITLVDEITSLKREVLDRNYFVVKSIDDFLMAKGIAEQKEHELLRRPLLKDFFEEAKEAFYEVEDLYVLPNFVGIHPSVKSEDCVMLHQMFCASGFQCYSGNQDASDCQLSERIIKVHRKLKSIDLKMISVIDDLKIYGDEVLQIKEYIANANTIKMFLKKEKLQHSISFKEKLLGQIERRVRDLAEKGANMAKIVINYGYFVVKSCEDLTMAEEVCNQEGKELWTNLFSGIALPINVCIHPSMLTQIHPSVIAQMDLHVKIARGPFSLKEPFILEPSGA